MDRTTLLNVGAIGKSAEHVLFLTSRPTAFEKKVLYKTSQSLSLSTYTFNIVEVLLHFLFWHFSNVHSTPVICQEAY